MRDAKPGAGRSGRYTTRDRRSMRGEDPDATGYAYDAVYQLYDEGDASSSGAMMLEGRLGVGFARVLEIRKLNGKTVQPRLSVKRSDAGLATAMVLPFVRRAGGGEGLAVDRQRAPPRLVPLLSLGRRVDISCDGGVYRAGAPIDAGGPALRPACLQREWFEAAAMEAEGEAVDLEAMKVPQLQAELAARRASKSGLKPALRERLRAVIIREQLARIEEEEEVTGVPE